jgi:hypothetical protein
MILYVKMYVCSGKQMLLEVEESRKQATRQFYEQVRNPTTNDRKIYLRLHQLERELGSAWVDPNSEVKPVASSTEENDLSAEEFHKRIDEVIQPLADQFKLLEEYSM